MTPLNKDTICVETILPEITISYDLNFFHSKRIEIYGSLDTKSKDKLFLFACVFFWIEHQIIELKNVIFWMLTKYPLFPLFLFLKFTFYCPIYNFLLFSAILPPFKSITLEKNVNQFIPVILTVHHSGFNESDCQFVWTRRNQFII